LLTNHHLEQPNTTTANNKNNFTTTIQTNTMCGPTQNMTSTQEYYTGLTQKLARKRPRKQVKFSIEVATSDDCSGVSQEEIQCMWYQRTDLALFKLEARDYILGTNTKTETRGFERYNVERARNKHLAIKCVLLATQKGMHEDQVGAIAHRCSEWSKNEAFKLGCQDYCVVYQPHMVGLLSCVDNVSSIKSNKSKRSVDDSSEGRCKRIRTC
jgi:hypothetical protein